MHGLEVGHAWHDRGTAGGGERAILEATGRMLVHTLREIGKPWRGDVPFHSDTKT